MNPSRENQKGPVIACVIPAWNEAPTSEASALPRVVAGLRGCVDRIIVVNDGSTDHTRSLAESLPVDLISHTVNRGQGAALRTGTVYALAEGADIIIHFDADGQFRAEDIAPVIAPLLSGEADVVFGSRFLDRSTQMPFLKRYLIMPVARLISRLFFRVKLSDPQSGFRAFTREVGENLHWSQDEMAHTTEILIKTHSGDWRVREVPITVIYDEFGQRFSGGFKILRDLFLAKLNH